MATDRLLVDYTQPRSVIEMIEWLAGNDVPELQHLAINLLHDVEALKAEVGALNRVGVKACDDLDEAMTQWAAARSDLAAMTSDRDWLRGEFEKATAGEHYWNFGCHKAERERDEARAERDALLPVAEAAEAWRVSPGDPEVVALLVAVDEWQSTRETT